MPHILHKTCPEATRAQRHPSPAHGRPRHSAHQEGPEPRTDSELRWITVRVLDQHGPHPPQGPGASTRGAGLRATHLPPFLGEGASGLGPKSQGAAQPHPQVQRGMPCPPAGPEHKRCCPPLCASAGRRQPSSRPAPLRAPSCAPSGQALLPSCFAQEGNVQMQLGAPGTGLVS